MTNNKVLGQWVEEVAALTRPDQVRWCDGSDGEYRKLVGEMLESGILKELNQETHPNCYLHLSNPNDVARVEHLTYVCTPTRDEAGSNNNWKNKIWPTDPNNPDSFVMIRPEARYILVRSTPLFRSDAVHPPQVGDLLLGQLDPAELIEFLRNELAYFMIPRYIRILDALPKTPTQKVEKHTLRRAGIAPDTWDREAAGIRPSR